MDTEGGGTWIGATQSGLCLCLLNLNPDPPVDLRGRGQLKSRGLVIPELLGSCPTVAEAIARLDEMGLRHYAPFRLLAVGPSPEGLRLAEARWDRTNLDVSWHAAPPLCLVSSGLGDALVVPRLDLFEELVVDPGPTPERQDEFHRHRWPTRPELSVMMSREDARTVSVTSLEVMAGRDGPAVSMGYEAVSEPVVATSLRARSVVP